jgi:hypothetical protein
MGDAQYRPIFLESFDRQLYLSFGGGIQRSGGFIEHKDWGIANKGARDGQSLTLPA